MAKATIYTQERCKRVINSVSRVLKSKDIEKLTKQAYTFITMKMGFIAHYDHSGFKGVYEQEGIQKFAQNLINGEVNSPNSNEDFAQKHIDGWFDSQYTREECVNIGNTMFEVIKLAEEYLENDD